MLHRTNRDKTYVGQSSFPAFFRKKAGKRIREHAGLHNKATVEIVKELGKDCKVTVYVIDIKIDIDIKDFITILIFLICTQKYFNLFFFYKKIN